jgi:amino acid adenylation domain-containing protein
VVGVPAAAQPRVGLPGLVGHCVSLLPIRVPVAIDGSVGDQLAGSRAAALDAFDHQGCTFGSILKKLQVDRDPARLPLVSVLFNLDADIDQRALSDERLQVRVVGNPRRFENFELFLNVAQADGGLRLECQYNAGLFAAATIRRWLDLYVTALRRIAADPGIGLAEALAPTASESALLARFNETALDHERGVRVEQLIARQAARTPDAIAVVAGAARLAYRELDARANAVAAALQARGVQPGELVGIFCGRNEHMMVALVGVLKAGAGYVPLDPALPRQRLEFMAQDAQLRHVLSDASIQGDWPFFAAGRVPVDELGVAAPPAAPHAGVEDVAYVIYTSGSTGVPKGVRVPHRSVANLLASLAVEPGMPAGQRVLSVTTLSFDIAVSELILPLVSGACIVLADRAQATDGERLRELIERETVDFIDGTPSTWRLLLASGWSGRRGLRAVCTGEPLPPDLGQQLLPLVGELWNGYGPTETTVWSSLHRVLRVDGPVPIGRPIANTQIHVVDERLRRLPIGAVGELYIAGEGVTLGYLNRPELTAERFVEAPDGGGRWYRTGDLGRWRADGVLECLGRIDHQVKVRGYRIELGEIESALSRQRGVARALVVTREDRPGDVRIVAYLVADAQGLPADVNLRRELAESLPDYMIPQSFVQLAALPTLPNGKLDRKALPKPGVPAAHGVERLAPQNDLERDVLAEMEAVLDLPGLAMTDSFFGLGGHSLLAMRLTARLNARFEVALPLRTLFEAPTAQALSVAIEAARTRGKATRLAIRHQPEQRHAPLTLMQERIRFLEELHPGRPVFNTPSGHRLTGPLDRARFAQALRRVVRRQPALRTRIVPAAGEGATQEVLADIDFELPFEDLSGIAGPERETVLLARMQAVVDEPIDIQAAPLFRVGLWKLADEEHAFLFMPHHIVWDGWSFDVLYAEMAAALADDTAQPLPEPAVTYVDYAHWLAQWLEGPDCARQLQYWKRRFATSSMPVAPKADKPRNPGMSGQGATEWVRFDRALTERLREVAQAHGLTLSMLTMSVYAAMLTSAIGSSCIVIGLPVRGRLAPELESVMGFFNNLLAVQFAVEPGWTVAEYLATTRSDTLDVFEHQEVPFERLAEEPEIAARAQRVGLYQALFSFQDARERRRQWGPLHQQSILLFQKGATEDLGLWLMEVPGGLEGGFTYNSDLYLPETAVALRRRYEELLRRVASSQASTLAELMASETESAQWLRRLSPGTAAAPAAPVRASAAAATSAFRTPGEAALGAIWAELLDIDIGQVAPSDNFFDLGGNSLLAMRAVEASGRALGFRIDARRYFYETLAQLANAEAARSIAPAAVASQERGAAASTGLLRKLFGAFGGKAGK